MNLGHQTVEAVKARARTTHAPFVHEQVDDDMHLKIEVQDSDKYGLLVRRLVVRRQQGATPPAPLAAQAAQAGSRFTYLLESLKVVELDEALGTAQLRSTAPYRETSALHYYEMLLRGGNELVLARYQTKGKSGGRELELSYFTEQVLARLCDDAVAVLHAQ